MGRNVISRAGASPAASLNPLNSVGGRNVISRTGAPVGVTGPPAPSRSSSGGGLLGKLEGVGSAIEHGVASTAGKAADVTASVGTGLYDIGKNETQAISDDLHGRNQAVNQREWSDLLHGHLVRMFQEADKGDATPAARAVSDMEQATGSSVVKSATSPSYIARHPLTAALNDLMLVSGGATVAGKLGYLAKVADTARVAETGKLVTKGSDAARAAVAAGHTVAPLSAQEKATLALKAISPTHRVTQPERFLNVPKLTAPDGEGPAQLTREPVQIGTASQTPLLRAAQGLHDKVAQNALDNGTTAATQTRTARYAERRVAGAVGETARITRNVRAADVAKVARAATRRNLDQGVPRKLAELSMFLRSANVTGQEAADFWRSQAAAGVGDRIKTGAGTGQLRTARLAKLAQAVHDKGLIKLGDDGNVAVDAARYPKLAAADAAVKMGQETREGIVSSKGLMTQEGLQKRLDLVGEKILGDQARPGQGFVTLKTSVGRSPQSPVARSSGNVIPLTRPLSLGKPATGAGVAKALVPAKASQAVARGLQEALRFVNSDELRGQVAKLGSDVKRTGDDILIRDPAAEKAVSTLPQDIQQMLGRSESTLTEPADDTLRAAGRKLLERAIPGIQDEFAADKAAAIGGRAPKGYKWVPRQLVPDDLTSSVAARGKAEKFADAVNSAVTSATVYFKLGHLPTRFLTNLSTNAVQGSLAPGELSRSVRLARDLSPSQKTDLLAATGTHGYQALPHAGVGAVAKAATKGANWWARRVDAPFRLNAILYELRQVGIDTPAAVDKAIGQLKDPTRTGMSGAEISKLDGAVRRANRASIMYDGLSAAEKRYVARYVWFYPWTKGAARFAAHTAAEHPVKAATGAAIGQQGSRYRQQILGDVPSYELGLTPYTGGARPLTGTISSFTPYGTAGDVAQLVAHPLDPDQGVFGQFNPYYSALATLIADSMAGKKNPVGAAAHQAVEPTPELQAIDAYLRPPGPTRMFGVTPLGATDSRIAAVLSALARGIGGAAVPRPVNTSVLHKQAQQHPPFTSTR